MPKKKPPKKHAPTEKRRGSVTREDLETCRDDLEDLAAGISAALTSAKKLKSPTFDIDGATKWERGFELLNQYINNVNRSLRDSLAAERRNR